MSIDFYILFWSMHLFPGFTVIHPPKGGTKTNPLRHISIKNHGVSRNIYGIVGFRKETVFVTDSLSAWPY